LETPQKVEIKEAVPVIENNVAVTEAVAEVNEAVPVFESNVAAPKTEVNDAVPVFESYAIAPEVEKRDIAPVLESTVALQEAEANDAVPVLNNNESVPVFVNPVISQETAVEANESIPVFVTPAPLPEAAIEVNEPAAEEEIMQRFRSGLHKPETPQEEDVREVLAGLFAHNPTVFPFSKQNRNAKWIQITPGDPVPTPLRDKLMAEGFVTSAYERFGHLLLGLVEEGPKPQYIIGVPDMFSPESRVKARKLGFMQFKCCEARQSEPGEFGYWLMFMHI
jgi:hypothetical protein